MEKEIKVTEKQKIPKNNLTKFLSIKEFIDKGYLQEVNRQFFHPLGLALLCVTEGENEYIRGIIDNRDDPEGIVFILNNDDEVNKAKELAKSIIKSKKIERFNKFGFFIQPLQILKSEDL